MTKVNAISGLTIEQVIQRTSRKESIGGDRAEGSGAFAEALQRAVAGGKGSVRFSAHAQRRMATRSIHFGQSQLKRLEQAVDKAASKGGQDSLILMDGLALIVNIRNRTVVTAIDRSSRRKGVFTNIDTVVMM
jgi:flagellar operon protein